MSQYKNILNKAIGGSLTLVGDTTQIRNVRGSVTYYIDRTEKIILLGYQAGSSMARTDMRAASTVVLPSAKIANATTSDAGAAVFTANAGRTVLAKANGYWFLFDYSDTVIYVAKDDALGDNPLQSPTWYVLADGVDVNNPLLNATTTIDVAALFVINDITLNIPDGYEGTFRIVDRHGSLLVGTNQLTSTTVPIMAAEYALGLNIAGLFMEMRVEGGQCTIVNYGGSPPSTLD